MQENRKSQTTSTKCQYHAANSKPRCCFGANWPASARIRHTMRKRARVFTPAEVAYCESRQRVKYQSYAARFAAKEATMKALGTGWNRNVGWNEIEVRRERGRAPQITLLGKAARFARNLGVKRLHLSLTHSSKDAIAHVIAET